MTNYDKLISILREVFQIDQADLDFGIYKIMNQRREQINQFLENDLLTQVESILAEAVGIDTSAVQEQLDKVISALRAAELTSSEIELTPKVIQLKKELAQAGDNTILQNDVFSHLTNFFKRYYHKGDFISMRRYKKDVYAIPYEGEEVKLHWANHDQYYIKTAEYLKNYSFMLPQGKKVVFELKEASTEKDNNKAQNGKERKFKVFEEQPLEVMSDTLLKIYFTYKTESKGEKQDDLNQQAFEAIKSQLNKDWFDVLQPKPTEKKKDRTLLEKHINDFTARNSFDYFIHKDLGGFLNRELDFYIKNEVLHIDDIDHEKPDHLVKQLSKVKAIKAIARKLITFLAQIEDFQKKMWLKKKFVVESNYCLTLDHIPESFYPEIVENTRQWKKWEKWFAISEIEADLFTDKGDKTALLKSQPYLVLDTKLFNGDFKLRLLAEIEDIDDKVNGLLVNSENFQALELLQGKYKNQVKSVYIDPPYNTEKDRSTGKFIYKDGFDHSSWLSFIYERLVLCHRLCSSDSVFYSSIDDVELYNLEKLLDRVYGNENKLANLIWISGRTAASHFTNAHEYILSYAKNQKALPFFRHNGDEIISDRAIKKPNEKNPPSQIFFPKGITFLGEDKVFPNKFGKEEPVEVIEGVFECKDGKLKNDVVLRAGWAMKDMIEKWIKGETVIDTKGQLLTRFFFKENGVLQYEKNKATFHPKSYIEKLTTKQGTIWLKNLFDEDVFDFPKPPSLIEFLGRTNLESNNVIIDFFAGSGTTGHAVINLNREDEGNRKFILVEMGEYFESVTKPRILKVIHSPDWKDGKPTNREGGSSHIIKTLRLESYEDTLNNLILQDHLTEYADLFSDAKNKESYMLHYMLEMESRDMLSIEDFEKPFDYQLTITENNEPTPTKVDMVETFNYLMGFSIKTQKHTEEGYRVLTAQNRAGENVLIIWRDFEKHSNEDLHNFFIANEWHENPTFKHIYTNGRTTLLTLRKETDNWQLHQIELEFRQRMFDVQDV